MWNTFLGKHIKPLSAEVVLALIPSQICSYQFRNRLDNLTLHSTRTVTFKLVAIKDRCSWFTWLYICASYSLHIFVIYCAFICQYYSLLFVQYFIRCSIFLFHFHLSFVFIVVQKRKEQFWTWTLFRYFDPVKKITCVTSYLLTTTCSTPSSRVNKHHTANSTDFVLV